MEKPLCLKLDEASREFIAAVEQISNKHGLPCYLLEPIVADVLMKVRSGKRDELERAKQAYEDAISGES